ncbi:hypothetical protein SAMN05443246_2378 [Paenibacillus sp. GP183]|nr:hypothetical protein SAMN05443246_2378 [Paenibacillus sp. GP183]
MNGGVGVSLLHGMILIINAKYGYLTGAIVLSGHFIGELAGVKMG